VKEVLQSNSTFQREKYWRYEKYPQMKWRNTCVIWNWTVFARDRSVCTLFPHVNEWDIKGILLRSKSFQVQNIHCVQKALLAEREKQVYLLEENHQCSKQQCLAHCFPKRIHLSFEKNTAYLSGFSSIRIITIVQIPTFKCKEEALYLQEGNHLCSKQNGIFVCFLMRTEVTF
jgi:hypothetical protein